MLYYKTDILARLKVAGYNTNKIRQEKIFGQSTLTMIRRGDVVDPATLNRLCELLRAQPGELIGWRPDPQKSDG